MMGVLEVAGAFKRLLGLSDELVHGKLLQACEKGESRLMDGRKDKCIIHRCSSDRVTGILSVVCA